MSHFDFARSRELADQPFIALIMAAMRKADSENYRRLARAFPEVEAELRARYGSPGGLTAAELSFDEFEKGRAR